MPLLLTMLALAMGDVSAQDVSPADPRPLNTPQQWVRGGDFPLLATLAGVSGKAEFQLDVTAEGGVAGCNITLSTGWKLLDLRTCDLLRERARFEPARDGKGRAVAAAWRNRFDWDLYRERGYLAPWRRSTQILVDPSGAVAGCSMQAAGRVEAGENHCRSFASAGAADRTALIGDASDGAVIEIRELQEFGKGTDVLLPRQAGAEVLALLRYRFAVDATGKISGCSLIDLRGLERTGRQNALCPRGLSYSPVPNGKVREVTLTRMVIRIPQPRQPLRAGPGETIT